MDGDGVLDLYVTSLGYSIPVSGKMIVCSDSRSRVNAAQAVVDALNALGFKLTLEELEYDDYHAALRAGNFDLYYGEVRLPPNFDLSAFFSANGSLNYGGLADDTFMPPPPFCFSQQKQNTPFSGKTQSRKTGQAERAVKE